MASISFTYNADYDSENTVSFVSNFSDAYTDEQATYLFVNEETGYAFFRGINKDYGTAFLDNDNLDSDGNQSRIGLEYAVNLDLSDNVGYVQLSGGRFGDVLSGGAGNDTLRGMGGADTLNGGGGNDRLVITDTPTSITGGAGKDVLFVTGGGNVSLTETGFTGIETVYVRSDTHLDMSQVATGTRIISQSATGRGVEVIATSGADTVKAGNGGDVIEGGSGSDKLYAGAGADTFQFKTSFGRDNIYGLDVATDHITIDIAGVDAGSMKLTAFHGGQDTIVSFVGVEGTNKIILHDVTVDQIKEGPSDLFMFGA